MNSIELAKELLEIEPFSLVRALEIMDPMDVSERSSFVSTLLAYAKGMNYEREVPIILEDDEACLLSQVFPITSEAGGTVYRMSLCSHWNSVKLLATQLEAIEKSSVEELERARFTSIWLSHTLHAFSSYESEPEADVFITRAIDAINSYAEAGFYGFQYSYLADLPDSIKSRFIPIVRMFCEKANRKDGSDPKVG